MKNLKSGNSARSAILNGVRKLAEQVSATMGASGRNILLEEYGVPIITKDGVTVAKKINLPDRFEDMGCQMVKQAAHETNETVGDGPQPLYSKILTPTGFVEMGTISVGDEICGTNGSVQKVVGVYPKGEREIYEVKLTDGRIVECCEDHLWSLVTHYGSEKIMTTKEIIQSGNLDKVGNDGSRMTYYYLPKTVVDFNEETLEIDPYFLGTLIGDGSLSGTGQIELSLGTNKKHIIDTIICPDGVEPKSKFYEEKNYYRVKFIGQSILKEKLDKIGLFGVKSLNKFIPKKYLYSNIESRKALLQGLLDTDGYINNRGLFEFSTVSEQLALDFLELCRGLGMSLYCWINTNRGEGSYSSTPVYRISQLQGYKYGFGIDNIEKTGRYTKMQCIKVSNEDNLYITDDYVVTHNTSTSTLLAYSMMERGMKYMSIPWWKFWQKKANAIAMKRGMTKAKDSIVEQLNAQKTPVTSKEQYQAIATISSQDEEVGKVVANVVEHVGEDGIVTTEGVATLGVEYDVVEGMKVDYPLVSPYFITDTKKLWSILVNTHVLITDKKITHFKQIIPLLKQITKEKEGSEVPRIFIICKDMRDEALLSSIANKNSGNLEISVVKYPEVQGYAEVLEDVAKLTGAKIVSEALGHRLEKVHFSDLGYAQRVISERHHVTITGGAGNIDSHVEDLRAQIEEEEDNTFTKERLAKLTGGVAIVKVGAATQVEQIERLHRVDDALAATRAAVEEGILPGGGVSYIRCKNTLNLEGDEKIGADIVFESIVEPFRTIVENAGENSSKILESVQKYAKHSPNVGYNTVSGKIEDMIEAHVINPTKVDRVALENAVSVASMFLTLEGAVCDIEKQDPPINYNLMDE